MTLKFEDGSKAETWKVCAVRQRTRRLRADVPIMAMDLRGVTKCAPRTRVEPFFNRDGDSAEERGATRYLGVYLSFAGWQVKKEVLLRMTRALNFETMATRPSFTQLVDIVRCLLISRSTYPRHLMPDDTTYTNYIRAPITKAAMGIIGLQGHETGDSPAAALLFSPKEGLGLGMPDPETAGLAMDARRLCDGLESTDDRQAAAIWIALKESIYEKTGTSRGSEGAYTTVIGRLPSSTSKAQHLYI